MSYDLFEVRVAGFIFNEKNELLLLKNKKGTWGILGGHLDKGEQIQDTMHREAKEEANIEVEIINQFSLKVISEKSSFIIGFACKYKSGEIKLQEKEVSEFKWVKLNELIELNLTFPELPEEAKKALGIIRDSKK